MIRNFINHRKYPIFQLNPLVPPALFILLLTWFFYPKPASPRIDESQTYSITAIVDRVKHSSSATHIDFQSPLNEDMDIEGIRWSVYGDSHPTIAPGDTISMVTRLRIPPGRRNPHGFDYRHYLWTRHIDILVDGTPEQVHIRPAKVFQVKRWFYHLRIGIGEQLDTWLGNDLGGMAAGLLLGERGHLDEDFRDRMGQLGLAHLMAVSGLHTGFIAILLGMLAVIGGGSPWVRFAIVSGGLLLYVLLTGAPSSVVRAATMAVIYLLGRALERDSQSWNLLAFAAIVSLALNPRSLFTAGFQLSFLAVGGILYYVPILNRQIMGTAWGARILNNRVGKFVLVGLLITLGAQAGTLPLTASMFGELPLFGLLANLVVVPMAAIVTMSGFIALAVSIISPWIGEIISNVTWAGLGIIKSLVSLSSQVPQLTWVTGAPNVFELVMITVVITSFPLWFTHWFGRVRLRAAIVVIGLPALFVWHDAVQEIPLKLTMLDVGQGDAIHLALPNGDHLLIDAGNASGGLDYGKRVVAPYLRMEGITHLAAVVVSHGHADHIGGIGSVMAEIETDQLVLPPSQASTDIYKRTVLRATELGAELRYLKAGDQLTFGNVDLFVLAPDSSQAMKLRGLNNTSLVLLVIYKDTSILLMGDAEIQIEKDLLKYGNLLNADILKVGHHGSATSSSMAFLNAVTPEIAGISVGRSNHYGHPNRETLARLNQAGAAVHRTDQNYALVLESDGYEWRQVVW